MDVRLEAWWIRFATNSAYCNSTASGTIVADLARRWRRGSDCRHRVNSDTLRLGMAAVQSVAGTSFKSLNCAISTEPERHNVTTNGEQKCEAVSGVSEPWSTPIPKLVHLVLSHISVMSALTDPQFSSLPL